MMNWLFRAECRDKDPDLFFPVAHTGRALVQLHKAKSVCQKCPVSRSCLEYALTSNQEFGVWGGTSEDERRALKRRKVRTAPTNRTA